MTGRLLAGLWLALITVGSLPADEPKLPEAKAYDKLVVEALLKVHNKGADLFNESKDYAGTYRMYQGALLAVRPLLAHRPAVQKIIDDGAGIAEREPTFAQRAFKLHETIEEVRSLLKAGGEPAAKASENKKPVEVMPSVPAETKKPAETKPNVPAETKKPVESKPTMPAENKKLEELKPKPQYELAPPPREKKVPEDPATATRPR